MATETHVARLHPEIAKILSDWANPPALPQAEWILRSGVEAEHDGQWGLWYSERDIQAVEREIARLRAATANLDTLPNRVR